MDHFYKRSGLSVALCLLITSICFAQTTISGTVTDTDNGESVPGVNVLVKGTSVGTTTNMDGNFTLDPGQPLPVTLRFSFTGYEPAEVTVSASNASGLSVQLKSSTSMLGTVTVVGNKEEDVLTAPVTVERIDLADIRQAATSEPYEALSSVKGVQMTYSSLTFRRSTRAGSPPLPIHGLFS